jgi:hypothetical protein
MLHAQAYRPVQGLQYCQVTMVFGMRGSTACQWNRVLGVAVVLQQWWRLKLQAVDTLSAMYCVIT